MVWVGLGGDVWPLMGKVEVGGEARREVGGVWVEMGGNGRG